MIVRVSTGHFPPARLEEIERLLNEGGARLIPAIRALPGCLHYYAGIDRSTCAIVNVSVWDSLEHALQMSTLAAMQHEGELMRARDVHFEPIANHETAWALSP